MVSHEEEVGRALVTHNRTLLSYVRRYLRSAADAEDVVQETFGEDTAQDTISVDVRLAQAASSLAALTLGVVLVDSSGSAAGSNAEGEGEGSDNGGEVHCDGFVV